MPVSEYVRVPHAPLSHLAHGWELHSATVLTPAEERSMLREPAAAVPDALARRLGPLRVLVVPYVACAPDGDRVSFTKPASETHSAVWVESEGRTHLVLACRELDAHDTGFEFLASVAEIARPKLPSDILDRFALLLEDEIERGVQGEIDEDAAAAKKLVAGRSLRRRNHDDWARYRDVAFSSTLAEYVHGLWHDVQIRVGPEHLPVADLKRRLEFMAKVFPPNEGYAVFAKELQEQL